MDERTPEGPGAGSESDPVRTAEQALRRLGFDRVRSEGRRAAHGEFWVRAAKGSDRLIQVLLPPWPGGEGGSDPTIDSILVVPNGAAADAAWARFRELAPPRPDPNFRILVLRPEGAKSAPAWHERTADRLEVLWLATGVLVGMLRRAAAEGEAGSVDFEEMLRILRVRFHVDVLRSLGVKSEEDALWMLYQIAHKHTYAPGDPGPNLHLLVLKPVGPAARLPWFAG